MKKTIKISLGRYAFTLDEEAHDLLENYLSKLELHYRENPNGKEIVEGIEEHIAELLLDRNLKDSVIDRNIIVDIIGRMGEPEDIDQGSGEQSPAPKRKKKLYRNPERSILSGVCGGLSVFFGVDVVLFRLLFVASAILIFALEAGDSAWWILVPALYLTLWIITPKARTFEQKCEMNGSRMSIPDVEKSVREGIANPPHIPQEQNNFFHKLLRFLGILLGICLILTGFVHGLLISAAYIGGRSLDLPLHEICTGLGVALTEILFVSSFGLFGLLLIYWGVLLVFRLKSPSWRPGLWALLLSILLGISGGISLFLYVAPVAASSQLLPGKAQLPQMDTLHIVLNDCPADWNERTSYDIEAHKNFYEFAYLNPIPGKYQWVCYPDIHVTTKRINHIEVEEHVEYVRLNPDRFNNNVLFEARSDTLYVDPFIIGRLDELEILSADLIIRAPEHCVIVVENPIRYELRNSNERYIYINTLFDR